MISVCAPYWNDQAGLDRMAEMYWRLYEDLNPQLSICDDGSPEPARIPQVGRGSPADVVLTRLPRKREPLNPCTPINRAVNASTRDIIALTKTKLVHDGPVLHEMLGMLTHEDDYVVAPCYGKGYGPPRIWLAGSDVDYNSRGRLPVPPGAHFHFLAVFYRSLWVKAGGFDEEYRNLQACDDNDWVWRLHNVGARFKLATGLVWQERSRTRWNLPHGRHLFLEKWPNAMAVAV